MIPYDAPMIDALLRRMPAERLAIVVPSDFQRWPLVVVTASSIIRELITNERARRREHHGQ